MDLSTAMRYVMVRAQAEAAALCRNEIYPEYILLGILKLAEVTAEDILPASRHKKETDQDICLLREQFAAIKVNTGSAREKLRRMLKVEPPIGNGAVLVEALFADAAVSESDELLYPSHVLTVILNNPTTIMKSALSLKDNINAKPDAEVYKNSNEVIKDDGSSLSFLSRLTTQIREMRYALLEKVHGQDHVIHAFSEGIFASEVLAEADESRKRPRAIFVFAGPPGVGKTFLAEQAAEALHLPYKRFDMSAYADHQAHIPLIGFAASYKDAKPGLLTGFVKENPHCILLFDEIEKANLNTIQLFLQVLDAGRLHDDFQDIDIAFKDTIIIFTTNAGQQLYENEHKYNAAGLSRHTILNALETDTHPQTGKAFFPAAICSRLATGYPMMFNHLAAHDLENICDGELRRCCGLFQKQYRINADFDKLLPTMLLFAEGGQIDARTLRAQSEMFFKNEIFKLCRLWGERMDEALKKLTEIKFEIDQASLPGDVSALFENPKEPDVLVFGDALLASRLQEVGSGINVFSAFDREEAFALLAKNDINLVLLKLVCDDAADFDPLATRMLLDEPIIDTGTIAAFENTPMSANPLSTARNFFKALRMSMPGLPVYLLESSGFVIDAELENAFVRAGARGKLASAVADTHLIIEEIRRIAAHLHLQSAAATLHAEHRLLSFETAPILSPDKATVIVRLREFALRRAADAADASVVLDEVEKPPVRFTDVIGASDAKDELVFFIEYLKNPKVFAAKGLKPPKGVMLYGPPGTGKTLLAKAMAGESNVAFIPAVASSFVTKWQGSGPEAVRELFKRARRYAPAIVFIDEIDAIGRARGGANSGHGEEMALNALLTEMDGFSVDPKRPVFVLAATNFNIEGDKGGMGVIDAALARRFDRSILVDLPTREDRLRYLEYMMGKHQAHSVSTAMMARLAERAAGLSLANLESVIALALRNAAKQNTPLCDALLEEAFEISRHGEQKNWGYEYLERVARHESGHAWLCFLGGNTPSYLTIVARGGHGGYMEHSDTESSPLQTKEALLSRVRTALGGRAAELLYYGDDDGISTGAAGDLESATRITKAIIANYGMDDGFGLAVLSRDEIEKGPLAADIRCSVNSILKEQMEKTRSLIRNGKEKIDKLVAALLEKNKLTREEMEEILKD